MRRSVALAIALLLTAGAARAGAGDLEFSLRDGRVTLIARDVPVRQILAEWARVGQSRIVNLDKLTGPPVTLRIIDLPEKQALDILLRSVSGYVLAPRPEPVADASHYDRIFILAQSRAPAASAAPPPVAAPVFQMQPGMNAVEDDNEPQEEGDFPAGFVPGGEEAAPPTGVTVSPRFPGQAPGRMPGRFPGPIQPTFPGTEPPVDQQQPPPVMTSPTPGVILAPPPQQGVPNPYGQPPVRPGPPPEPDVD